MDEPIDYVVPIGPPIPCLSINFGLQEFLVLAPMVDPLMPLPHFVSTPV